MVLHLWLLHTYEEVPYPDCPHTIKHVYKRLLPAGLYGSKHDTQQAAKALPHAEVVPTDFDPSDEEREQLAAYIAWDDCLASAYEEEVDWNNTLPSSCTQADTIESYAALLPVWDTCHHCIHDHIITHELPDPRFDRYQHPAFSLTRPEHTDPEDAIWIPVPLHLYPVREDL